MDEIDRILKEDGVIEPTTGFSTRVMRAVREEAERPAPMEFPWSRFLPGLVTCVALMLGTFVVLAATGEPSAAGTAVAAAPELPSLEWLDTSLGRGLLWAAAALLGSGLLVWGVLRLGGQRHSVGF